MTTSTKENEMPNNFPNTEEELKAIQVAADLISRSAQDDVPTEVFNSALENYRRVSMMVAEARLLRELKSQNLAQ